MPIRLLDFLSEDELRAIIEDEVWLLPPIEEWWDPTGGLPDDPEVGDRYGSDGDAEGWRDGYIYEWDGSTWVESSAPEEGWMVWALVELMFYVFFSGGWRGVGEGEYVKIAGDTMTGTLTFTDEYSPSPAASETEPAIRANRNIVIKCGHKLIFDGA